MPITSGGLTVLEVMDECRNVYLNDSTSQIFTNDKLIAQVQAAYQELEDRLVNCGVHYTQEVHTDTTISAGATAFTTLPSDLIAPVELFERTPGTTEEWAPMYQKRWPVNFIPVEHLIYWVWSEGVVKFAGATTARSVRMRYRKALASLAGTSSVIIVPNAKTFISRKTSALAARFIGQNYELADKLDIMAEVAKEELIGALVKDIQGTGVRARPFRAFRQGR